MKKRIASFLDVLFLIGRASTGSHPGESPLRQDRDSLPFLEEIQCFPSMPRIRALANNRRKCRRASGTSDSTGSLCPGSFSRVKAGPSQAGSGEVMG